jgi:hypothetical protein
MFLTAISFDPLHGALESFEELGKAVADKEVSDERVQELQGQYVVALKEFWDTVERWGKRG